MKRLPKVCKETDCIGLLGQLEEKKYVRCWFQRLQISGNCSLTFHVITARVSLHALGEKKKQWELARFQPRSHFDACVAHEVKASDCMCVM